MKKSIVYALLVFFAKNLVAQDNNYWMQMPGAMSSLMGGAVVAGVRDNSAIFYNPGALAFIDTTTLSISASAYQYEMANIKNAGGVGVNLSSGQLQIFPLVAISGVIMPKRNAKNELGYMLFTKNQTASNFSYRYDGLKDNNILAGDGYTSRNAGVEYIGDYNLQTQLNELWLGFSYSHQISNHISIGVSPFIAYRTQSLNQSFIARVFPDSSSNFYNGGVSSMEYNDMQSIAFSNFRTLGKIGIAFDYGKLKIGATFTTRSFNLGGKAMVARDISGNDASAFGGISNDSLVSSYSFVLNDRQYLKKSTYTSPFSVSFGIDYQLNKTTFAFSAEYFGAVASYDLATPQANSFYRPVWQNKSSLPAYQYNSNEFLRIREASKSVTNFGFAIEHQVKRNLCLVTSFRSDFTSYKKASNDFWEFLSVDTVNKAGQKISISNINLYHFTFGAVFKNKRSDIHLGISYCFGINKLYEPFNNIAAPSDQGNILGAVPNNNTLAQYPNNSYTPNAIYKYAAFSLLLGYTYHITSLK